MATIAGLDCADGALLAGDRTVVRNGAVVGSRRHVFGFDGAGAAAVGDDPDAFRRQLDAATRRYVAERGGQGIDAFSRMAREAADEAGVEALVAARGDDGRVRVRSVTDGVLDERVAALGGAAPVVLGSLEAVGELDLDGAESRVRDAFDVAATRDAGTGEEVDVLRFRDADAIEGDDGPG